MRVSLLRLESLPPDIHTLGSLNKVVLSQRFRILRSLCGRAAALIGRPGHRAESEAGSAGVKGG